MFVASDSSESLCHEGSGEAPASLAASWYDCMNDSFFSLPLHRRGEVYQSKSRTRANDRLVGRLQFKICPANPFFVDGVQTHRKKSRSPM